MGARRRWPGGLGRTPIVDRAPRRQALLYCTWCDRALHRGSSTRVALHFAPRLHVIRPPPVVPRMLARGGWSDALAVLLALAPVHHRCAGHRLACHRPASGARCVVEQRRRDDRLRPRHHPRCGGARRVRHRDLRGPPPERPAMGRRMRRTTTTAPAIAPSRTWAAFRRATPTIRPVASPG